MFNPISSRKGFSPDAIYAAAMVAVAVLMTRGSKGLEESDNTTLVGRELASIVRKVEKGEAISSNVCGVSPPRLDFTSAPSFLFYCSVLREALSKHATSSGILDKGMERPRPSLEYT